MTARARGATALLVLAALAAAAVFLPVKPALAAFIGWLRGLGAAGAVVFFAVYVLATVLLVPGSVLTLGAGFVYGPLWGTALVSPSSVAAATVAFLLGRSVARDWIGARVQSRPDFAAIDEAVGRAGFKIVLLLRLSPVFPFSLLNYALGLTRVRLRDYVAASFLGMLPGTVMYVYLGSLAGSAAELLAGRKGPRPAATTALYWGGLAATVVVTVLVTRLARRALAQAVPPAAAAPPEPPA